LNLAGAGLERWPKSLHSASEQRKDDQNLIRRHI
jgi:hypothetical protein